MLSIRAAIEARRMAARREPPEGSVAADATADATAKAKAEADQ